MNINITSHISTQPTPTVPLTDTAITQQPSTPTHSAHTDGPSAKTPRAKAPFNSEAATAYSTFREAVLKSRQPGFNSPTVSEEKKTDDILSRQKRSDSPPPSNREGAGEANDLFDALYPPTPEPPKSEDSAGANDLFNTLYPRPAATPAPKPAPPKNGIDEGMGADTLHNDLLHDAQQARDKRINAQTNPAGDSQLAKTIANTMLGLKDSDLEKPLPMVDVPKGSTLGKWLKETNNALKNKALVDWVKERNIDPSSLSYDSGKKVLYGKTADNEVKSFTQDVFPNFFSKHADAFIPLEEIAIKMDPTENGVTLSFKPTDKASLDFVQNFYGLSVNNKDISSIHQAANDLSSSDSFPERAGLPDRSDKELSFQKERIADLDDKFDYLENIARKQDWHLAIEVSSTGSAR